MTLYQETTKMWPWWPEPIESFYQLLGKGQATELAPKLPHLSLADILFMTAVMSLTQRPWGIVTWMAEAFGLSRQGLYDLTVCGVDVGISGQDGHPSSAGRHSCCRQRHGE